MQSVNSQAKAMNTNKGSYKFDRYQSVVFLFHTCVRCILMFCRVTINGGEGEGSIVV